MARPTVLKWGTWLVFKPVCRDSSSEISHCLLLISFGKSRFKPPTTISDESYSQSHIFLEYRIVCLLVVIGTPTTPSPASECAPPPLPEPPACGGGGHNSDDLRESILLCLLCGATPALPSKLHTADAHTHTYNNYLVIFFWTFISISVWYCQNSSY